LTLFPELTGQVIDMKCKASVIIVSYNNYRTTTGPCLESLLKDRDIENTEIIIVDNASNDDTPFLLKQHTKVLENVTLLFNNENRGFGGGNNDGVANATGEIIILLNSDTIVPAGSIGKICTYLKSADRKMLLGPVTNEAGNEQKIFISSTRASDILREGTNWSSEPNNCLFQADRLDFFCVSMLKSIYEELNGLDEGFGLGFYEDYDFSLRAREKGCEIYFSEDIFIYHKGSCSFSRRSAAETKNLMHQNKKLLQMKHSGRISFYGVREGNLNVLRQYIDAKRMNTANNNNDLDHKFDRRYFFAQTMFPRNPIKRLQYRIKLKNLRNEYIKG
jgi:GT2 family glycosyltransferase